MSLLWIAPTLRFWGAVFGPFRPFSYPQVDVAPSVGSFLAGFGICLLPRLLPGAYFNCWEGSRGIRVYRQLGIEQFRRFATNGDLVNRWARRSDAHYRFIASKASLHDWTRGTRDGERNHLVLFLMGLLSSAFAVRIGWYGWAVAMMTGNLVFNAYPVLLQRFNRCRVMRGRAASLVSVPR